MSKATYRWDVEPFQNGCCGIASITRMSYTSLRDYKFCEDTLGSSILKTTKEYLKAYDDDIGLFDGNIALTAVTSKQTPEQWVTYFEKSRKWVKQFEFVNTKTGNPCIMWKTVLEFTTEDGVDDIDADEDFSFAN